jgi:hypothetical protein
VLELGGVRNVLAKSLGTTNPINMAKATVVALQSLRRPEDVARIRGKQISEVLPLPRIKPEVAAADVPATGDAHEETPPAAEIPAQIEEPTEEPAPAADASPVAKPAASGQAEEKPKRRIRKKDDS